MKKLIKSKKGMSLIEIIVATAIFAMLAVFIASVFIASLNMVNENAKLKKNMADAAAGIENTMGGFEPDSDISAVSSIDGKFQITFNGIVYEIEGKYISGRDSSGNAKYNYFNPD